MLFFNIFFKNKKIHEISCNPVEKRKKMCYNIPVLILRKTPETDLAHSADRAGRDKGGIRSFLKEKVLL